MKIVTLTQGQVAFVDDEDFDRLNRLRWYALKSGNTFYAIHSGPRRDGKQHPVRMHRLVMGTTVEVDHINGNGLDNRKQNLRTVTRQQNSMNRRPRHNGSSRFKGVSWHGASGKWSAFVRADGAMKHLGLFSTEDAAARAYDRAATQHFGQYARTNFQQEAVQCA